jgi:hypothetical protein
MRFAHGYRFSCLEIASRFEGGARSVSGLLLFTATPQINWRVRYEANFQFLWRTIRSATDVSAHSRLSTNHYLYAMAALDAPAR